MSSDGGMGLMKGRRGLIMGLANDKSIAWGIAKAAADAGAELAFTYQGDALKKRVEPLAKELGGHVVGHCDVTDPATIDAVFAETEKLFGSIDFLIHCIAFSDKDELTGRYVETSEANFTKSLLISCYSFTAITQRAENTINEVTAAMGLPSLRSGAYKISPIPTVGRTCSRGFLPAARCMNGLFGKRALLVPRKSFTRKIIAICRT